VKILQYCVTLHAYRLCCIYKPLFKKEATFFDDDEEEVFYKDQFKHELDWNKFFRYSKWNDFERDC